MTPNSDRKNKNVDKILLSFLSSYDSLSQALQSTFGMPKKWYKKYGLKKKELIRPVKAKELIHIPLDLVNHRRINPNYSGPPIETIYEDQDFLVLNKPPGIHGHPLLNSDQKNCLSFLRRIGKWECLNILANKHERGLLYRLDSGTSGVLVLLKSEENLIYLRSHFTSTVKEKIYWAITSGRANIEGIHEHYLVGSGEKKSVMQIKNAGQKSILEILNSRYIKDKNVTFHQIKLATGVRHQIRAQLAFLGHPILGDTLYGGELAERIFLHAYSYNLVLKNKQYQFVARNAFLFDFFLDLNCQF